MLSLMGQENNDLPIALGVIRDVDEPTYDILVNEQINEVKNKSDIKCFDDLIDSLETWEL
jgi:2-oxoglutarate ferredoxin oxidoreductase subunit beta